MNNTTDKSEHVDEQDVLQRLTVLAEANNFDGAEDFINWLEGSSSLSMKQVDDVIQQHDKAISAARETASDTTKARQDIRDEATQQAHTAHTQHKEQLE